jgi:hypothetical protein
VAEEMGIGFSCRVFFVIKGSLSSKEYNVRIISLFVAFCFSLNVMASSGTIQELERHLDDYHYALSVEWDQKDNKFYQEQTEAFFEKLNKLIKEDGLSQKDLLTLMEKKTNNKQLIDALKLKLSLSQINSSEELAKVVRQSTKDMYAQGASWNGNVLFPVAIGLLVAAVVGYAIWWNANHQCVATETRWVCNTYNNCNYYGGGWDPYYGGYYGGTYCYGNGYTTCGYTDVCTRYARK